MKIKLTGDWFGLSFGVFLLVAAIVAIPAGEWVGGQLVRPGTSLPQVQSVALAQNSAENAATPAIAPPPASVAPSDTSAPSALDALPSIPSLGIGATPPASRRAAAAKPPAAAAPAPSPAAPAASEFSAAAPKVAPKEAPPTAAPTSGGTWLQVAALMREDNARALADKLKSKGYPVFVKEPRRDTLYHVQVGPYPNQQAARMAAQSLKADGLDAIVID